MGPISATFEASGPSHFGLALEGGVSLVVRALTPLGGGSEWGGEFSLRTAAPAASFVDAVAAQLGLSLGAARGKTEPPGVEGSLVVFGYQPGRALQAKLALLDDALEQHEVYFDVEAGGATFRTKDERSDLEVLRILAYGLRDGHRGARPKRVKRVRSLRSFEDVLAALSSERDDDYEALTAAVQAERERFVGYIPQLLAALESARRKPISVARSNMLSSGRGLLGRLESEEASGQLALDLLDADEAVRRDALIGLEMMGRPTHPAHRVLELPGAKKVLLAALDRRIAKYVLVAPVREMERMIALRKQLAAR